MPQVLSLRVDAYRGEPSEVLGRIGASPRTVRVDDEVEVAARFDATVFGYLIAMDPEGRVQLCQPMEEGEAPLLLLFSGTAFTGPGGFQVEPVPWDREAGCRLPVRVWREMIEQHFPGCGWLRLPEATMDALLAFRSRQALPSWEATVEALLDAAAATAPGFAPVPAGADPQERTAL